MTRLFVDEEFPFKSHWYDRGEGHRMHYIDEGEGDPIVCVHGNPTWSFFFRHLITRMSRSNRVIAIDHIGCGFSDKPSAQNYNYRLANRIDPQNRSEEKTRPSRHSIGSDPCRTRLGRSHRIRCRRTQSRQILLAGGDEHGSIFIARWKTVSVDHPSRS